MRVAPPAGASPVVAAMFNALDAYIAEANLAAREIERSLEVLEAYLAVPFVDDDVWLWYV